MELTLNELKILRNALNAKLRTVHLKSSEFDEIKQTLYKINFEIERIEYDTKQKACDEAFRAISDIIKPKKINHSFINLEVVLDEIREAAFRLEAQGAEFKKIIILAPKYFIYMLCYEFGIMIGDKGNREDKMFLFGYRVFPSFENKITVYDEDIVVDLGRLPIKIELI